MIVDTDVLIWYMRGSSKAQRAIDDLDNFSISVVAYVELVQGLRNKAELNILRNFLQSRSVPVLHVDENISSTAMFLVEQHHLLNTMRFLFGRDNQKCRFMDGHYLTKPGILPFFPKLPPPDRVG